MTMGHSLTNECSRDGQLRNIPSRSYISKQIYPDEKLPVRAWTENEICCKTNASTDITGESKRLLNTPEILRESSSLQDGLTLGVWNARKPSKCTLIPEFQLARVKLNYQERKAYILKLLKPPYFICSMIILIVLNYVFDSSMLRDALEWTAGPWWREPWRLFTYSCLHANLVHVALNALFALVFGWLLEREQSWWRVGVVWWCGVVAGALGVDALQPHIHMIGASAAVYALLTAHITNVCLRFGHISLWWFRPLSVVVLVMSEVCWAMYVQPSGVDSTVSTAHAAQPHSDGSRHIAWAAHLLGGASGVPVAFLVFTGENKSSQCITICRFLSAVALLLGIAWAFIYNVLIKRVVI